MITLQDLINKGFGIDHCFTEPECFARPIVFTGFGWYSKDGDNVYRQGEFATYSRIKVSEKTYACADCKYYEKHHCKLWQVKIEDPEDSHCESANIGQRK